MGEAVCPQCIQDARVAGCAGECIFEQPQLLMRVAALARSSGGGEQGNDGRGELAHSNCAKHNDDARARRRCWTVGIVADTRAA